MVESGHGAMIGAALAILGASLLGSVHCAAMCGGFACFAAGSADAARPHPPHTTSFAPHAMYNAGRLVSYLALGASAGAIGSGVERLGALAGIARAATILAGVLMVMWGASTVVSHRFTTGVAAAAPAWWQRRIGGALLRVRESSPAVRAALTGMLTTLLPCGWLYVFVASAGGTGSALGGGALMFVFWLGTVPAMVTVAAGAMRLLAPLRTRLPLVSASLVLVMGLLAITGRLTFAHVH